MAPKGSKNKSGNKNQKAESGDVKEGGDVKKEPLASKNKKITNKVGMDKGDLNVEEVQAEDPKVKPAKGKRGQRKGVEPAVEDDQQEQEKFSSKRRRKAEEKDNAYQLLAPAVKDEQEKANLKSEKQKKNRPKVLKVHTPEDSEKNIDKTKDAEKIKDGSEIEAKKKGRKLQLKKVKTGDVKAIGDVKKEPVALKEKKAMKKDEMDQDKVEVQEDDSIVKPAKGKRGQRKVVESAEEYEEREQEEPSSKRRRKADEEKAPAEGKKKAPPKNKATTNYEGIDFSNTSKNGQGKEWNYKISSWNVDGIRAWLSKGGLDYIKYEKPDILCLQETKCSQDKLPGEITNLPGYHAYWLCSEKDGYAGVAIYTTKLAMNVQYGLQNEELDSEGRIITAEYEQFYLICTYVPNAGRKLVTLPKRLQWNKEFRKYVKELDKEKPVIICGDMNVAHEEIDLANPKSNKKNAGFTVEERAGMTELLGDGFVDTFRHFYPDKRGAYTFWTYMMNCRAKNIGWRLDYFLVSERLLPLLCDNAIRDLVYGSDHCPISLFLHLTSADKPKE